MLLSNSFDSEFSVSWTHRLRFTDSSFNDGTLDALISTLSPLKILPVIDCGVTTNTAFYG